MKLATFIDPKAAVRDNGPRAGLVVADIDLSDLTSEQRRVLAVGNDYRPRDGVPAEAGYVTYPNRGYNRGVLDHDNLVAWLDGILADESAKAAAKKAAEDKYVDEKRAEVLAGVLPDLNLYYARNAEIEAMPEYRRLKAEAEAQEAAKKAEREAAAKAETEAAEAAKAAAKAEREAWIRAHGSPRLRRCLEEGIAHAGIYRDERLAAERPGWNWDTEGTNEDPINPPEAAFAMLDEARKTAPAAKLTLLVIEEETDDETGEITREASDSFAAVADFLGRGIIYSRTIPRG